MGLARAFDNRSLGIKIGTAVLAATVSGLVVGGVAILKLHDQNADAAAAQRKATAVGSASAAFAKNVEGFAEGIFALQLYPSVADVITQKLAANKTAVEGALGSLGQNLASDPAGVSAVAKAKTNWEAFSSFAGADHTNLSKAELAQSVQKFNALADALATDEAALQERAEAQSEQTIAAAQQASRTAGWALTGCWSRVCCSAC